MNSQPTGRRFFYFTANSALRHPDTKFLKAAIDFADNSGNAVRRSNCAWTAVERRRTTSSKSIDRDAANRGVPKPPQCGGVWRFQVVHHKVAHEARQDDGPLSVLCRPSL